MAAVLYADGKERNDSLTNESMEKIWISPATMDSADTVDVPTIAGRTVRIISAFDNSLGASVTATVSGQTITLDAAGGATDQVYVVKYFYE